MPIYKLEDIAPKIAADAWVAPDANIIGNIILRPASSVWFNATLRGDNETIEIGHGSNVQENCVLHTDLGYPLTVGESCTIGHKAILHGCTIKDRSLIGMGAVILNGAVIEEDCLIGAGALIPEGKVIPAGSLVMGAPGKVVKQLSDEMRDKLLVSAEIYQQNAKRFRDGLEEIQ